MNFKVGQRVKVVACDAKPEYVGRPGTFLGYQAHWAGDCSVQFDGDTVPKFGPSQTLAPLTPPNESDNEAARQFIERMKRIAHEPMPVKEPA